MPLCMSVVTLAAGVPLSSLFLALLLVVVVE